MVDKFYKSDSGEPVNAVDLGEDKMCIYNDINTLKIKDLFVLMSSNIHSNQMIAEYLYCKIKQHDLEDMIIKYRVNEFKEQKNELVCGNINIIEDQLYYLNEYIKTLKIRAAAEGIKL